MLYHLNIAVNPTVIPVSSADIVAKQCKFKCLSCAINFIKNESCQNIWWSWSRYKTLYQKLHYRCLFASFCLLLCIHFVLQGIGCTLLAPQMPFPRPSVFLTSLVLQGIDSPMLGPRTLFPIASAFFFVFLFLAPFFCFFDADMQCLHFADHNAKQETSTTAAATAFLSIKVIWVMDISV